MLASRQFDMSQTHGQNAATEEFKFYEGREISLSLVDQENLIDKIEEAIEEMKQEIAVLTIEIDDIDPPNHKTIELSGRIRFLKGRIQRAIRQIEEIKQFLDKQHEEERDDIELFHLPYHYMYAREYWNHILDWIIKNPARFGRKEALRLYTKVNHAYRRKNVSSWYYYMISYHCVIALNMQSEKRRLLKFAEKCSKNPDWFPKKKEEVKVDTENMFLSEWKEGLTENELVEAIDRRR
jgi:hypothetical protein